MRADLLDEYETKQSREKKSKVVKYVCNMWLSSLYFGFFLNSCFSLISSIMRNDYIENIFSPF